MNLTFIYHSLVVFALLALPGMVHPEYGPFTDQNDLDLRDVFSTANGHQNSVCVELVTPQDLTVAKVCLSNSKNSLEVRFQAEEGWLFLETQLAAAASLKGIPKVGPGIPALGQFIYKSSHSAATTEQAYSIALDSLGVSLGTEITVAAHVSVINETKEEEGAWGRGERFVEEGNPATYFKYLLDNNGGN